MSDWCYAEGVEYSLEELGREAYQTGCPKCGANCWEYGSRLPARRQLEKETVSTAQPKLEGKIIAVDFDGTCVTHAYPKVGRFIGAPAVLQKLVDAGAKLILWTMRSGEQLNDAAAWFAYHNIPLYGVNVNPGQSSWTSSPKVYAHIYIDDAALGAPLCEGLNGERPYIDWEKVEKMLLG